MFTLILTFLLALAILIVALWAFTNWFQGYIYSEVEPQITWRAPAAGSIVAVFLAVWCLIESRAPGKYDTLFRFSPWEEKQYNEFQSVKGGETSTFKFQNSRGYMQAAPPHRKWSVSDVIIVDENGEQVRFEAEKDEKGNFKRVRSRPPAGLGWLVGPGPERPLRYVDERGRAMTEDSIGRVSTFHWGLFIADLLLNAVHLLIWFGCLWLVLRFQWSHAFGLSLVIWLLMTIIVVPVLFDRIAQKAAPEAVKTVNT